MYCCFGAPKRVPKNGRRKAQLTVFYNILRMMEGLGMLDHTYFTYDGASDPSRIRILARFKPPSYVKYVLLRKKLQGNPKDAPRAPRGSRRTLSCYHAIIYSYSGTFILSYSHSPILFYSHTLILCYSHTFILSTLISSYSRTLLFSDSHTLNRRRAREARE